MADFLLDTNHLSAAIRRVSPLRDRLQQARRLGVKFGTCLEVLCELEAGIQQTANPEGHRRRLKSLLEFVRLWPLERTDTITYGALFLEVTRRGRVLSHVDLILCVLAQKLNVVVLTTDRDFEAVPSIRIENWLSNDGFQSSS